VGLITIVHNTQLLRYSPTGWLHQFRLNVPETPRFDLFQFYFVYALNLIDRVRIHNGQYYYYEHAPPPPPPRPATKMQDRFPPSLSSPAPHLNLVTPLTSTSYPAIPSNKSRSLRASLSLHVERVRSQNFIRAVTLNSQ
jgi:hypothetical protein